MALESGTFVEDLIVTNPPGSDTKSQGDDHIRLIKTTLRNTFKRATRFFTIPGVVSKTANYTVLLADDNMTIACDTTTAAFTLTLPVLAVGDAGWSIRILKNDASNNTVFLSPQGGQTINGFTRVRRTTPTALTLVYWNGAQFVATRPTGHLIGEVIDYYGAGAVLPQGFLWCDGQAFDTVAYTELNVIIGGIVPDFRGRVTVGRDNMGVGAANRVTVGNSGINGTSLFAAGGTETIASATLSVSSPGGSTAILFGSLGPNMQPSCIAHKIICAE
jgi:hypothetical protein